MPHKTHFVTNFQPFCYLPILAESSFLFMSRLDPINGVSPERYFKKRDILQSTPLLERLLLFRV